jgi:GTPase SAR1 family protein
LNTFDGQSNAASAHDYYATALSRATGSPSGNGGRGANVATTTTTTAPTSPVEPSQPAPSARPAPAAASSPASNRAATPVSQTPSVKFESVLEYQKRGDHSKMQLAVHDLGGQPEFYDLLKLLISRCCVYLVVFNLEDFALQGEAGRRAEQRCVSYLKFWLSCISERSARGSDGTPAPVILVGTHADTVNNVSDLVLFAHLLSLTKYYSSSAPAAATCF